MKTNVDDIFRDLEIDDLPARSFALLRLTEDAGATPSQEHPARPIEIARANDTADQTTESLDSPDAPMLRLTTHDMVAMLDASGDERRRLSAPPALKTTSVIAPADRPTVLHVRVVCSTGGGPEKTILRSPEHARDEYFNMALAYIHPRGDNGIEVIKSQAQSRNATFFAIPESGPLDPRTIRALYQLCKQQNVAVWHGHDYKSNLLGLIIRRFWKMKLVTTVHGWTNDTFRTRLYYHVDKWCLPRYDEVIAVSPLLHEQCLNIGVEESKLTYIANGIDCGEYQRKRNHRQARSELGIYRDALIIGVVARLSAEKGVDRAIRTVADLHTRYPKIELHIIGDGPEYDRLKQMAVELGVAGIVQFWGYQGQLQRFYELFDMLLLPSLTEGFPNVVLEAMAMGVPVAAASVGAVPELLKYGRRGVILDARDQSSWADHIAPLIVSKDRRRELARLGRARVEKYYSFDLRMKKVFKIYDRVLSIAPKQELGEWRRAA